MKNGPNIDSDTNQLTTKDRRWAIMQEVQNKRRISVTELTESFGLSEVSIRRDLEYLHKMGLVQRVRGGAQALSRPGQGSVFEARLLKNQEVKRSIGRVAADLIRPGCRVLLDSGTTVLEVAQSIPDSLLESGELTLITRSLSIASKLRYERNVRLFVLGGLYMRDFDTFVGSQIKTAIQDIHVDLLFIGTDGIVPDRGLTTDNTLESDLYQSLARCADRVVVVTDSSKIGVDKLKTILHFGEIHVLVTDTDAPEGFVESLRQRGAEVILAPKHDLEGAQKA